MAPKYDLVEIPGVPMSSTYLGDRGVDLSLLGDQLISGVTVSKTLSASMDPNAMGGTVGMTRKTAEFGWACSCWGNGRYTNLDKSLKKYRVSGMANTLDLRLTEAQNNILSFSELLSMVITDELQTRSNRKLRRFMRHAHADPSKTLETFDSWFNPSKG